MIAFVDVLRNKNIPAVHGTFQSSAACSTLARVTAWRPDSAQVYGIKH